MATSEKNGVAWAKEKTAGSKRLYWGFGTAVVAAVLFTFYVSGYVSSQQTYYNERAFRLLSSMADKFALHVKNADNVLRASASFENGDQANQYIHKVLHTKVQDHDFMVTRWHKPNAKAIPTREGTTTLFLPEEANNFRVRADYREMLSAPADEKNAKALTPPNKPCDDMSADIVLCATINFDPLVVRHLMILKKVFSTTFLLLIQKAMYCISNLPKESGSATWAVCNFCKTVARRSILQKRFTNFWA